MKFFLFVIFFSEVALALVYEKQEDAGKYNKEGLWEESVFISNNHDYPVTILGSQGECSCYKRLLLDVKKIAPRSKIEAKLLFNLDGLSVGDSRDVNILFSLRNEKENRRFVEKFSLKLNKKINDNFVVWPNKKAVVLSRLAIDKEEMYFFIYHNKKHLEKDWVFHSTNKNIDLVADDNIVFVEGNGRFSYKQKFFINIINKEKLKKTKGNIKVSMKNSSLTGDGYATYSLILY